MPVLRSQTVYLSITAFLSLTLSQQHTLLLSHVPCFVSASRCSCSFICLALSQHHACSCSLMYLALSQHHAALALSCTLLCLSITLLLLSHVPCFVSASRCSCSLMYLALSQHHAALALSCTLPQHAALLSHVPCFVSSRCSCPACALLCLRLAIGGGTRGQRGL